MIYRFVVAGLENYEVILKDDNGEIVVWPKNKLPENIALGSSLYFTVHSQKNLAEDEPQLAKDILNEILNIS
jgi:hypothetical protein